MKKCLLFAFMTIMGLVCCHAQDFAQYKQNLDWQVYNYPQEKIHVMTDKPYYITGDTVWLRAFVVNAVNHQPVDASKFVYVELISPMNEVSMRIGFCLSTRPKLPRVNTLSPPTPCSCRTRESSTFSRRR